MWCMVYAHLRHTGAELITMMTHELISNIKWRDQLTRKLKIRKPDHLDEYLDLSAQDGVWVQGKPTPPYTATPPLTLHTHHQVPTGSSRLQRFTTFVLLWSFANNKTCVCTGMQDILVYFFTPGMGMCIMMRYFLALALARTFLGCNRARLRSATSQYTTIHHHTPPYTMLTALWFQIAAGRAQPDPPASLGAPGVWHCVVVYADAWWCMVLSPFVHSYTHSARHCKNAVRQTIQAQARRLKQLRRRQRRTCFSGSGGTSVQERRCVSAYHCVVVYADAWWCTVVFGTTLIPSLLQSFVPGVFVFHPAGCACAANPEARTTTKSHLRPRARATSLAAAAPTMRAMTQLLLWTRSHHHR